MADPFGAIHNQNIGDIGVFVGNGSWAASGQMPAEVPVRLIGPHAQLATYAPYWNLVTEARRFQITDGSAANPVTAADKATFLVTRESKLTTGSDGGLITGIAIADSGTTVQTGVFQAFGRMVGNADILGFGANLVTEGNANACLPMFASGQANTAGGGVIAYSSNVVNNTSANSAYTALVFGGIDLVYGDGGAGGGGHYGGAAAIIRANAGSAGDRWDAGIYVLGDSIRSYVIDASAATTATSWHGKFTIDNEIQITRATGSAYFERFVGTGTGAKTWGLTVLTNSRWALDEVGVQQVFQIAPGTPGANKTSLYILEGATPTLRQITTFDPGAAGINFTAGQLVAVLV